ncbi:F0F1 ATP synthase subunit gamma [Desulfohalovibrio reitneri]|uniref:F0F1 ATP synthase subunit gamma n=1 Tax=Desulfohalovibrio reitneri TaxID=1307759 RepID=UPI0004A6C861|nr:F0F1 ATP synthase subunit gamma [Desulfohalovibrio reitneri]
MAESTEALARRISGAEDLHSVVKTMKAMAAVNIRHFQDAAESMERYRHTVELGFTAVLRSRPDLLSRSRPALPDAPLGAVLFGSDQGMCGQLNEEVGRLYLRTLRDENRDPHKVSLLAMGERLAGFAEEAATAPEKMFHVPGGADGIGRLVRSMLVSVEEWTRQRGIERLALFYSREAERGGTEAVVDELLPLDREWMRRLARREWPTRSLPVVTMDTGELYSRLVRQYLFSGFFRAVAQSLAAENAARLASMQGAESSIRDKLRELRQSYQQQRQNAITEEIIDIVSGFEALEESGEAK